MKIRAFWSNEKRIPLVIVVKGHRNFLNRGIVHLIDDRFSIYWIRFIERIRKNQSRRMMNRIWVWLLTWILFTLIQLPKWNVFQAFIIITSPSTVNILLTIIDHELLLLIILRTLCLIFNLYWEIKEGIRNLFIGWI